MLQKYTKFLKPPNVFLWISLFLLIVNSNKSSQCLFMNISRSLLLSVRCLEFEVVSTTNQLKTLLTQFAFQILPKLRLLYSQVHHIQFLTLNYVYDLVSPTCPISIRILVVSYSPISFNIILWMCSHKAFV